MNTTAENLRIAINQASSAELLSKVYTDERAAAIAGCDIDTLAAKANAGEVPGIKWGRGWRYPALAFHLALNHAAIERLHKPKATGETGDVGKKAPAANDPATAGRRKPRAAPVLPDLRTAFKTAT